MIRTFLIAACISDYLRAWVGLVLRVRAARHRLMSTKHARFGASIATLFVAACSSAPTNGLDRLDATVEPDAADTTPDAAPAFDAESPPDAEAPPDARVGPRIFRGRAVWYEGAGPTPDLTRWQFSASQDGRVVASSVGRTDGTFELEVPDGEIRVDMVDGTAFRRFVRTVVTGLDSVVLTVFLPVPRARTGTSLSIDGNLAAPWNTADEMVVISPKLQGGYSRSVQPNLSNGDLTFGPITFDWSDRPQHRGRAEDDLFVVRQTLTSTAGGVWEVIVSELVGLQDLNIANGARTSHSGVNLSALPTSDPVELRYRGPDARLFNPRMPLHRTIDARTGRTYLAVRHYGSDATEASVTRRIPEVPGSEGTTFFFEAIAEARYPGFDNGYFYLPAARKKLFVARPSGVIDMTPSLGQPTALRIAGQLTHAGEIAGVGLTPLLEWEAPQAGHCDGYVVELFGLSTGEFIGEVGMAWTTHTSFAIPPGWMTPGVRYYVLVSAFDREGESVVRRIVYDGVEQASVLSEPFTP